MVRSFCGAVLVLSLMLAGCASHEEALADKDRRINAERAEKGNLEKQLADARATRSLLEKQLEQQRAEKERLDRRAEELASERARLQEELAARAEAERAAALQKPEVVIDDPNVEVDRRPTGEVVLRISDRVTFTPGSADLTKQGRKTLSGVASVLKKHEDYMISVEGHTDDTPLKSTKARWGNNRNLSIARALAVETYLARVGVRKGRMRIVGYGSTAPLINAKTDQARARNRRVELVLYQPE